MPNLLLAALAVCACAAPPRTSSPPGNVAALRAALDADLRADWDALLAARADVARLHPEGAAKHYHLGWIDWRMSSMAYLVTGSTGMAQLLERAVDELSRSVALDASSGEAQALLAVTSIMLANVQRERMPTVMPTVRAAWEVALASAAESPRVQLLRAMSEFWMPPEAGGGRDRGVERWKRAIALFERKPATPDDDPPFWGHAEAWAWLGGAYMTMGKHTEAADALQHALALRPDFWWAKVALAQAVKPQP